MRRPGVIAVTTAAVMLAVALPAVGVNWTPVDATVIPTDKSARVVSDAIERDFGGAGSTPRHRRGHRAVVRTPPRCARSPAESAASTACGRSRRRPTSAAAPGASTAAVPGDPAGDTAQDVVDGDPRPRPAVRDGGDRPGGGVRRPAGRDRLAAAARRAAAVRADLRRAVADDRLGRAAGEGDRDERADRRRGAGPAAVHLPGRPLRGPARLHVQRRRRADGLPRHRGASCSRSRPTTACSCSAASRRRATAARPTARRWPSASPAPAAS